MLNVEVTHRPLGTAPALRSFWRRLALSLLVVVVAVFFTAAPATASHAQTIVTFTFDDGRTSNYTRALPLLTGHGMAGTFFVNSGNIGSAGTYCCMTWSQVNGLFSAGNEIAGHTKNHKSLTDRSTTYDYKVDQVCGDLQALVDRGYRPSSFAYPSAEYDDTAKQIVRSCSATDADGVAYRYASARAAGGISATGPPYYETIPPQDAYATRTTRSSCVSGATNCEELTAEKLKPFIVAAHDHLAAGSSGWVQFVFHEVCADSDRNCLTNTWRPIKESEFGALLDWLQAAGLGGAPGGTVVRTVGEVINGGTTSPPPPPPPADTTPPSVTITSPSDGASFKRGTKVKVSAEASDTESGVSEVKFYVNGQLVGTDTAAPYDVTWTTRKVSPGQHELHAVARDRAGNSASSQAVTVTVTSDRA